MSRDHHDVRRVLLIGSSTHFLSGISLYTHRLSVALSGRYELSVILMRKLIPQRFYPGRSRVGAKITEVRYPDQVEVVDGVDWHGRGLLKAATLLFRTRPDVVIFQWWTGAVLHLYVPLALLARASGARVVVEFHETQDTGEAGIPGVAAYVRLLSGLFMRLAGGSVVHSQSDVGAVCEHFGVGDRPLAVIPHGPFDHLQPAAAIRTAPRDLINVLFFGTIRPYKGLEDLVEAFNGLEPDLAARYWLTVVGETWEGWTLPASLIESSRYRDRITFVNHYVTDEQLSGHMAGADVIALPYRRSSASGPLHATMTAGLPVIVTDVGGLSAAAGDYQGAIFVPASDPEAIRKALIETSEKVGEHFEDPHSWDRTVEKYEQLFTEL